MTYQMMDTSVPVCMASHVTHRQAHRSLACQFWGYRRLALGTTWPTWGPQTWLPHWERKKL